MVKILILNSSTKNDLIYIDTIYNPLETKTFRFLKQEGKKFLTVLICLFIKDKNLLFMNKINPEIDNGLIELLNQNLKMKIGITGSLSSGKTTASKILSAKKSAFQCR